MNFGDYLKKVLRPAEERIYPEPEAEPPPSSVNPLFEQYDVDTFIEMFLDTLEKDWEHIPLEQQKSIASTERTFDGSGSPDFYRGAIAVMVLLSKLDMIARSWGAQMALATTMGVLTAVIGKKFRAAQE